MAPWSMVKMRHSTLMDMTSMILCLYEGQTYDDVTTLELISMAGTNFFFQENTR
jgi:hypothetical protein